MYVFLGCCAVQLQRKIISLSMTTGRHVLETENGIHGHAKSFYAEKEESDSSPCQIQRSYRSCLANTDDTPIELKECLHEGVTSLLCNPPPPWLI